MSPVDFKKCPCHKVEFKKWLCRHVECRGSWSLYTYEKITRKINHDQFLSSKEYFLAVTLESQVCPMGQLIMKLS